MKCPLCPEEEMVRQTKETKDLCLDCYLCEKCEAIYCGAVGNWFFKGKEDQLMTNSKEEFVRWAKLRSFE